MTTSYETEIERLDGTKFVLPIEIGRSTVIIGANGSGKTRLSVELENRLPGHLVQRIAAHKSLAIPDRLQLISYARAANALRYGYADGDSGQKASHRWQGNPAVHMLSDFEALLQALFAEQSATAVRYLHVRRSDTSAEPPQTKIDILQRIWRSLLPHRGIIFEDALVRARPPVEPRKEGERHPKPYPGSQMSDGERSILYFLGQCLLAPNDGIIIIDEPDNHINRAIAAQLWDAVEAERSDCAFVYITHDLDFLVDRAGAQRFYVRAYDAAHARWDIEELPQGHGIRPDVVATIAGSRRRTLFTEGGADGIDSTVYRAVYSSFGIVPLGSESDVVHAVTSFRRNQYLHRLGAVNGIVDRDDRTDVDIAALSNFGIGVLPVTEIENLLMIPEVFIELAKAMYCKEPERKASELACYAFEIVGDEIDEVCARYTSRRIDRLLKMVDLKANDGATLISKYQSAMNAIDPQKIFSDAKSRLNGVIEKRDFEELLAVYDNKGLLARAAVLLGLKNRRELIEKLGRILNVEGGANVVSALRKRLPSF